VTSAPLSTQTASGKTFTMEGPDIFDHSMRGIIPRVVDTVFEKIEASPPTIDFTIKVSMVEIYLEKLRDLLDPTRDNLEVMLLRSCSPLSLHPPPPSLISSCSSHAVSLTHSLPLPPSLPPSLPPFLPSCLPGSLPVFSGISLSLSLWYASPQIRERRDVGIYVEGMFEQFVTSSDMVYETIRRGSDNRAVASTNMNRDSSRSHSVFILTLVQKNLETLSCVTGGW
jgi:hypothetical protein